MLSEKKVESIFKKYKIACIRRLGSKATTDKQLNGYARKKFGSKFIGVFMQDRVPWGRFLRGKKKYAIVNTDPMYNKNGGENPGEHWIAIARTGKEVIVYDSFSRNPRRLVPLLTKHLLGHRLKIMTTQPDVEQKGSSQVCGCLCIAFLQVYDKHGSKNALLI